MATRNPAPEQPIRTYPSPDIRDQVLIEWVTSEQAFSNPVAPGTEHPNSRDFPDFKLGKQVVNPQDHNFFIRYYVHDQHDPDTFTPAYNYAIQYSGESSEHPIYIAAYRELKEGYTPRENGSTITRFGASAKLVKEEAQQFPEDSEFYALYFNVIRVYETLPGPWIYSTRIDDDGVVVTVATRRSLSGNIVSSETLIGGVWKRTNKKGSDVSTAEEIVETRTIPGNAMPGTKLDKDGNEIDVVRTMKAGSEIETSESVSGGIWLRVTKEAISDLVAWEIVEARAIPGTPVPSASVAEDHQVATVATQLVEGSSITPQVTEADGVITAVEQREVTELVSEQVTTSKPFLDRKLYQISIPDLIPNEFKAFIPKRIESHVVAGEATQPTLGAGEFERSEQQLTKILKEVRFTVLDDIGSLPISIVGMKETNELKQVVDVSTTLEVDTTVPTVPTALIDVDFRKLGNGLAIEIVKSVPDVFDAKVRAVGTPLVVPERFRATDSFLTAEDTVEGTISDSPTLLTGEVERQESQLKNFIKKIRRVLFNLGLTPTLHWQQYDEQYDIEIPSTETVETAGSGIGRAKTEVTPIGAGLELDRTLDIAEAATLFDNYKLEFAGTTNINLPNVLTALYAFEERSAGDADVTSTAGSAVITNAGSWTLSPDEESQASVSMMFDIDPTIKEKWGANRPVMHYIFLLPSPAPYSAVILKLAGLVGATVNPWPKFNPETITVFCVGGHASVKVKASAHWHHGFNTCSECNSAEDADSSGDGVSREAGLTIKAVRIPATIHGAVPITGTVDDTYTATASAAADAYLISSDRSEDVDVSGYVTTLAAITPTEGASAIPSIGKFLLNIDPAPYKYGYIRFHCEVIDAADL